MQAQTVTMITAAVDETALAADSMSSTIAAIRADTENVASEIDEVEKSFGEVDEQMAKFKAIGRQVRPAISPPDGGRDKHGIKHVSSERFRGYPALAMERNRVARLSEGQRACLRMVYRHMETKEIARILGISPDGVAQRIKTAMRILGVNRRRDAARILAEAEGAPPPTRRWLTRHGTLRPRPNRR